MLSLEKCTIYERILVMEAFYGCVKSEKRNRIKMPTRTLKVGSHHPFFRSNYFSGFVLVHRNVDSHH